MDLFMDFVLVFAPALDQTAHLQHGAHGVVVSHPFRMRKALGSNPSVSILCDDNHRIRGQAMSWVCVQCSCHLVVNQQRVRR